MTRAVVRQEEWGAWLGREIERLGKEFYSDPKNCVDPEHRPFDFDRELFMQLATAGFVKIVTARRDAELVGCMLWTVQKNIESKRCLIASPIWYVKKTAPWKTAWDLWCFSLEMLGDLGVHAVFPQHNVGDKGLERFFTGWGAKPVQVIYYKWTGSKKYYYDIWTDKMVPSEA